MYLSDRTVDDLMHRVLRGLLSTNRKFKATRGEFVEKAGVLLQLTNPRARLSQTEKRGKLFSCIGELLWYLSASNSVNFITHYAPQYKKDCVDGKTIYGGYGPRLFRTKRDNIRIDQIGNVIKLLQTNRGSRRGVIQLFDAADIATPNKEIPCTCTLQFMIRGDRLNMFVSMRSNDAFLGLPHDIFAFTMLQEIVARSLGVELGSYKHFAASLHLYTENQSDAQQYLDEGWQSTEGVQMPPMPVGDPWRSIAKVLGAERAIRGGSTVNVKALGLDAYWADIIRLLLIHAYGKRKDAEAIRKIKRTMSRHVYHPYIDRRHERAVRLRDEGPRQLRLL
jgi:thymidylate synthase